MRFPPREPREGQDSARVGVRRRHAHPRRAAAAAQRSLRRLLRRLQPLAAHDARELHQVVLGLQPAPRRRRRQPRRRARGRRARRERSRPRRRQGGVMWCHPCHPRIIIIDGRPRERARAAHAVRIAPPLLLLRKTSSSHRERSIACSCADAKLHANNNWGLLTAEVRHWDINTGAQQWPCGTDGVTYWSGSPRDR